MSVPKGRLSFRDPAVLSSGAHHVVRYNETFDEVDQGYVGYATAFQRRK